MEGHAFTYCMFVSRPWKRDEVRVTLELLDGTSVSLRLSGVGMLSPLATLVREPWTPPPSAHYGGRYPIVVTTLARRERRWGWKLIGGDDPLLHRWLQVRSSHRVLHFRSHLMAKSIVGMCFHRSELVQFMIWERRCHCIGGIGTPIFYPVTIVLSNLPQNLTSFCDCAYILYTQFIDLVGSQDHISRWIT